MEPCHEINAHKTPYVLVVIRPVYITDIEAGGYKRGRYFLVPIRGLVVRVPVAIRVVEIRGGNYEPSAGRKKRKEPFKQVDAFLKRDVLYHLGQNDYVELLLYLVEAVIIVLLGAVYIHGLIGYGGVFLLYLFSAAKFPCDDVQQFLLQNEFIHRRVNLAYLFSVSVKLAPAESVFFTLH